MFLRRKWLVGSSKWLPYCFKVTNLPKILGILTTRGEKDNFIALGGRSGLCEVRFTRATSDYLLLDIYVIPYQVLDLTLKRTYMHTLVS